MSNQAYRQIGGIVCNSDRYETHSESPYDFVDDDLMNMRHFLAEYKGQSASRV